jgi:hypothetical protein
MKREYCGTLRMMTTLHGVDTNSLNHCTRGLEYRTKCGGRRRQQNKMNAMAAVLDEQERQRILGIDDDVTLSNVYIRSSAHCAEEAHALGMQDLNEAFTIFQHEFCRTPKPIVTKASQTKQGPGQNSPLESLCSTSDSPEKIGGIRRLFQRSQSEAIKGDMKSVSTKRSSRSQ